MFLRFTQVFVLPDWQWTNIPSSSYCICRFLTNKEKFHEFIDSEWQGPKGGKVGENETAEESKETSVEGPETKKLKLDPEERNKTEKPDGKRLRGQNKSRPHIKPTTYDEKRLCLSVIKVWSFNQAFTNTAYMLIIGLFVIMTSPIYSG